MQKRDMFGNFSQHFVDVGEVITSQGSISTVSDDAFVFTGAGKTLLLDYNSADTMKYLNGRQEAVRDALEPYIGKKEVKPNDMINTLIGLKYTKTAISRVFDGVIMDTGSFLFRNSPAAAEYTFVDTPSVVSTIIEKDEITDITDVYTLIKRGEKKKAADIVSFLCGLAAQVVYSSRGAVAYAPMSNYVYSAERRGGGQVLIVNDPFGEGWKVMPVSSAADMSPRGTSELLEYSVQLVANSLFGNEGILRTSILSSGVITSSGKGVLTSLDNMGDAIERVDLTEGHVSINYSPSASKVLTVSVQPELASSSASPTPSILSWFNMKANGIAPERGGGGLVGVGGGEEEEYQEEDESKHVFVCPFARSSAGDSSSSPLAAERRRLSCNKRCKLTNNASVTWREHLLRLGTYVKRRRRQPPYLQTSVVYKVKNLSVIVGDVSLQASTQQPPSAFTEDVANAAYALVDFENYNKILPILDTGTANVASFTVVGNTPQGGGHSLRVVRLLKKKQQQEQEQQSQPQQQQQNKNGNWPVVSSPGCKWYGLSPTSLTAFVPSESSGGRDVYVYTPRCVYHCKTAYVHLFADGDDASPLNSIVLYETDNSYYLRMSVEEDDTLTAVKKPLGVAAVTTAVKAPVYLEDDSVTARPMDLTAARDKWTGSVKFTTEGGGEEFLSEDLVGKLMWFSNGEPVDPPVYLTKRVDFRGKVINMTLVRVDAVERSRRCSRQQRQPSSSSSTSTMAVEMPVPPAPTRYPSPLDSTLNKYRNTATTAAAAADEVPRRAAVLPSTPKTTTIADIVMIM